jgi:sec-independent protein translocase protein TatC
VWRFIEPALYKHEKRYAGPFIISTTICFVAGVVFGYEIVAPWLFKLELVMAREAHLEMAMSAESFFTMLVATVVSMGAIFEMPPIIFILSRIGLIDARFLILTPSTQIPPMLFFMAVMTGIYVISILVAVVFGRTRRVL